MPETTSGIKKVSKDEYRTEQKRLRVELLNTQFDLRETDFSVLIKLNGEDRAGCNEILDLLHEWLDARYMETHVFVEPTQEARERPRFWRYWQALPTRGRIGLHMGGWLLNAVADRTRDEIDKKGFDRRLDDIERLERMLVDDGTLLLKFWMHLPRKALKKRLDKARKDPAAARYVDGRDWKIYEDYEKILPLCKRALDRTDTATAPWIVVDGSDREFRNLTVARTLLTALQQRLSSGTNAPAIAADLPVTADAIRAVDLTSTLPRAEYKTRMDAAQTRLSVLSRKARKAGLSTALVFEGWDAAGKGGCIRRMTRAMAAQDYRVVPIAAPTDEELGHHYLWRFWRRLPPAGDMVIYDRSWYGRVLVERVENLAREDEWRRAYDEIKHFESQLTGHGMVVLKFWLHIDPDEQLRRFKAREQTPYKKYKLTDEDFRNREKWDDYAAAVNEMVARTHSSSAPWHIVPANDKRFARVAVIEAVCDALNSALKR